MRAWLPKIEKALVLVLVFLFPTQLALHFWPDWAFIFGIRSDYLAPAVYLTDILVVSLLLLGFKSIIKYLSAFKYKKYLVYLLALSLFNIYFSISPVVSVFKWLKVLEFVLLAVYFATRLKTSDWKSVYQSSFLSLMLFSLIGIDQFLIGKTIGGVLYWLGERSFTISTPGIALHTLLGRDILRSYSTFSHPNALAGYLGLSLILLLTTEFFKKDIKRIAGVLLIGLCLLLTFSLSAFLATGVVLLLIILHAKKSLLQKLAPSIFALIVLGSLLLPIISKSLLLEKTFDSNVSERLNLAVVSGKLINQNFWMGTGLNTFTIAMTQVKPTETSSWLLQPVHNIFLLVFSEVGIFGLLLFVFYFYKSLKAAPLIVVFIILTGFVDHYWLDSQQNLLLLALISGKLTSWKS